MTDVGQAGIQIVVDANGRELPVVEARTPEPRLVQLEPQGRDQMEMRAGVGAKSYDIAGIRWNLGLVEHDVYQLRRPPTHSMDKTL